MKRFKVHKCLCIIAALGAAAFGQDITLSKDSITVYNHPVSIYPDQVIFTSHNSTPIHLDSAYVQVAELDTVGYGYPGMQVAWSANTPIFQQFVWGMDSITPDTYRLVKNVFYPGTTEPLTFSGNGDTSKIFFLQIGYCFQCQLPPKFPRYIRGTLRLFFSNGQVIELRIRSIDLRTGVRHREFVLHKENPKSGNYRYLANGRRVGAGAKIQLWKEQAIRTYLPDKGR
jgi:hypothetical protein